MDGGGTKGSEVGDQGREVFRCARCPLAIGDLVSSVLEGRQAQLSCGWISWETFIMLLFMGNARHAIDSLHHYMIRTIRSSPTKMSNTCPVFDMGTTPKCLLS
ncbi:hypothetical protein NC652_033136 [Populus alba x Populus x berolinensis]|nr:hypothetical protein NC652_033136 [Populus alba x Populus x berolinensis]